MKTEQFIWSADTGWGSTGSPRPGEHVTLVLAFGPRSAFEETAALDAVRAAYPGTTVVGCSTAGSVAGNSVIDESLVFTAVTFAKTRIVAVEQTIESDADSGPCGERLGASLPAVGLVHVMAICNGLHANGTELVRGLSSGLPPGVAVTGGMAADGPHFGKTLVYSDGRACERKVVAIGFYGEALRMGYGSVGGWNTFGPQRTVTRSKGNVLYDLDGESALTLYKRYLGPHADELPASGLHFPLTITAPGSPPLVRTIIGVNEAEGSLIYAGDIPQGIKARLMQSNMDRLIHGATEAATAARAHLGGEAADLAVLVSCVGRKLVLRQRTEEEVEAVRGVVGPRPTMAGFYSYGELAPTASSAQCELHNQTMTITLFSEAA